MSRKHLLIPDTQVKVGTPTDHLAAIGNYIVAKQPEVIVQIGDWADMHSLSSYDVGTRSHEGVRIQEDINAAYDAMEIMLAPLHRLQRQQRLNKKKIYNPEMHLTTGNHEYRIERHIEQNPVLEGTLSMDSLGYEDFGWNVHPFLKIVEIDGIHYSHYFVNPHSLRKGVVGGTIDTKLKNLGYSFTMGHQQILQYGIHYQTNNIVRQGLVAGAFYMHDEAYMGPQGNQHWRGCVLKRDVQNGRYDPQFLSLENILKRWL